MRAECAVPLETGCPGSDLAALQRFLGAHPNRPLAWRRLGQHELRRRNRDGAIAAFERAAVEYVRCGQTLRAVDCLKRLVGALPTYAPGFVSLGNCIASLGFDTEAQYYFVRAAELHLAAEAPGQATDVLQSALAMWPDVLCFARLLARAQAAISARSGRVAAMLH